MYDIVIISGSPSNASNSHGVLGYTRRILESHALSTHLISVRDLPLKDLLHAQAESTAVRGQTELLAHAGGIIVGSPTFRSSFSGVLKTYLDLLPDGIFAGKAVLPISSAATLSQIGDFEAAIKPVLTDLGAHKILPGLTLLDSQIEWSEDREIRLPDNIDHSLHAALQLLAQNIRK
ncbi:NAD(P)H-dependent oxidoreductase [Capsulimonas corticalis]|nr:NAD(P)H-dependent oxidoreductase [Capsulimonas corticalis]